MTLNLKMMEVVASMLLEAELKDIFNTIDAGKFIYVTTTDKKQYIYQVESNITGNIIMKDVVSEVEYILNKDSLDNKNLKIWKYNGGTTDNKDEGLVLTIDAISVVNKAGTTQIIDVEGDEDDYEKKENLSRLDEYNNLIKTLEKGDVLRITTETESDEEGGDSIVNDLFFETVGINKNWYVFKLKDINANVDGEEAIETQKLVRVISDKDLAVGKGGFFKIINNKITLNLVIVKPKSTIVIKGIIDVKINNIEGDIDYDEENSTYSKKELKYDIMKDKNFRDMLEKQPNLLGKLRGASPRGLMQLKNMIQQHSTKNSYLTKGNFIKFKVINKDIVVDLNHKLLKKEGMYYQAKVTDENTLKLGRKNSGNWEINLKDEIEENTYNSEVNFCKSDGSCKLMAKNVIIKILTNG